MCEILLGRGVDKALDGTVLGLLRITDGLCRGSEETILHQSRLVVLRINNKSVPVLGENKTPL